jgi:hypothetical protein
LIAAHVLDWKVIALRSGTLEYEEHGYIQLREKVV